MILESTDEISSASEAGNYDTVVVGIGIISIVIAIVYWVMRIGFVDPIEPPAKAVALALFIHGTPVLASEILRRFDKSVESKWWRSVPFLWLMNVLIAALIGTLVPLTGINLMPLLAAVGVGSFVFILLRWIKDGQALTSVLFILLCSAFAVWASGVVWGRIYKNPLYLENYIAKGVIHHDTLAVISIANMLRTYGAATIGVDGLNYMPWHWGSMWLCAQYGYLVGLKMVTFYMLAYPIIAIPLFFGAPLAVSQFLRNRRERDAVYIDVRSDIRFWFVFLAACIGVLPIAALDAMGVWTSNLVISDSYTFGVPCALLFLATCIAFFDHMRSGESELSTARLTIGDSVFVVLVIPVMIVALGYLKSSLMPLGVAVAAYMFLRLRLYRRPVFSVAMALLAVLAFFGYREVVLPGHEEGFAPLDFLWNFVRPAWWVFFPFVHLFWSLLYAALRVRVEGVGTLGDLRDAVEERRLLDVEVILVVAFIGLLPGLLLHIDGGSAFYVSDVQRWLALAFLLSWLPAIIHSFASEPVKRSAFDQRPGIGGFLDRLSLRKVVVAFLLIPLLGSMLANSLVWPLAMIRSNVATRHYLYPDSIAVKIPLGVHGFAYLRDSALLDHGLRSSRNYPVAAALLRLSDMPDAERRQTALFIPQSDSLYWKSLTRKGACTFDSFMAPVLGSIAMVDGMPPYGCKVSRYYGLGSFASRRRPQTSADQTPQALCARARARGFNRIVTLSFANSSMSTATANIDCRQIAGTAEVRNNADSIAH